MIVREAGDAISQVTLSFSGQERRQTMAATVAAIGPELFPEELLHLVEEGGGMLTVPDFAEQVQIQVGYAISPPEKLSPVAESITVLAVSVTRTKNYGFWWAIGYRSAPPADIKLRQIACKKTSDSHPFVPTLVSGTAAGGLVLLEPKTRLCYVDPEQGAFKVLRSTQHGPSFKIWDLTTATVGTEEKIFATFSSLRGNATVTGLVQYSLLGDEEQTWSALASVGGVLVGVAIDAQGLAYVTRPGVKEIHRLRLVSGAVPKLLSAIGGAQALGPLVLDVPGDRLFVADPMGGGLYKVDYFHRDEPGAAIKIAELGEPRALALDRGGRLYVADAAKVALSQASLAARTPSKSPPKSTSTNHCPKPTRTRFQAFGSGVTEFMEDSANSDVDFTRFFGVFFAAKGRKIGFDGALVLLPSHPELGQRGDLPLHTTVFIKFTSYGAKGRVEAASLALDPSQVFSVDLNKPPAGAGIAGPVRAAGLDIVYDGPPGMLLSKLESRDAAGDYPYDYPVRDPEQAENTGGSYPWRLDGGRRTVVHIKNTTGQIQRALIQVRWPGGSNTPPEATLGPWESAALDLERLLPRSSPESAEPP